MTTFTHRLEIGYEDEGRPRLAVKCAIDVEGLVSHAGCAALVEHGSPAGADATIVRTARQQGAVVVGHTVMSELGLNATGINPLMGTPANPLDPARVPGGSSSGSVVAVATGDADVAYGTDAGGSCRIPPACCGVVGLKPTQDRFPTHGVTGLTLTMDVPGPLARDVPGVVLGTTWMQPGFEVGGVPALRIGRLRVGEVDAHVDGAVDDALRRYAATTDAVVVDIAVAELDGWADAYNAAGILLVDEGWRQHGHLLESHPDAFSEAAANKLRIGRHVDDDKRAWVASTRKRVRAGVDARLGDVHVLALPTIPTLPPRLDEVEPRHDLILSRLTMPFNLSGHPALAMPVPTPGQVIPASLQLVAPREAEELLLATALAVESALT